MPIYKKPEDKAVETVTIRLTLNERRMLDHLSAVDEVTLTDFIRGLIARRATELGITELPPRAPRRRPGRPKKNRPVQVAASAVDAPEIEPFSKPDVPAVVPSLSPTVESSSGLVASVPVLSYPSVVPNGSALSDVSPNPEPLSSDEGFVYNPPAASPPADSHGERSLFSEGIVGAGPASFGDLVVRFREGFAHRADGTKRELEETITFLCQQTDGPPILSPAVLLDTLTPETLAAVRDRIRTSPVRLAKKNLYLTYLRMMLHFGVKEPDLTLRINPSRELPPFSIVESDDRRRFFTGMGD